VGRDFRFRSSEGFVCRRCKRAVSAEGYGTRQRNHCCFCLWSLHVDERPGDRQSACRALMEPIGIWVKDDGEWSLIHRCTACARLRTNRVAGGDDPWSMMALAARPLSRPPFPLVP
jgi:hypothetical protein